MSTIVLNPLRIWADVWQHRYLLGQLIKRDVLLRYRGAMFGVLWIFLSPLFMLIIFAFVFGQIFQARWPQQIGKLHGQVMLFPLLLRLSSVIEASREEFADALRCDQL